MNTKIPLSRYKSRQYTGVVTVGPPSVGGLTTLNKYGQFSHKFDETLQSLQTSFAGITKPLTNFQSGNGAMSDGDPKKISMVQRWLMSSQYTNINDISYNETYNDYLGLGPYYLIDYEKPSDNTCTNLTVRIN